jgi:uncharacterized protein
VNSVPRAVLDTNVVLSALLFAHGRLLPIRLGWCREIFQPLVSTATAAELIRVLNYPKFKLTADDHDELLADYLPYCSTVKMPARAPRVPSCRDPYDLPFLQLALCGKADYLVTGDRDLLDIDEKLPYAITTPDMFMASLHLR